MRWTPLRIAGAAALGLLALSALAAKSARAAEFPPDKWGKKGVGGGKAVWLRGIVDATNGIITEGGMPLSVAYGQAAVETGWGGSGRNNPWGIRGTGDAGSQAWSTSEHLDGEWVEQSGQKFAKYTSEAAAAHAYVAFLSGPMYRDGWHYRSADPGRWLLWLWGMGYASAPGYPGAVVDCSRNVAVTLGDASLAVEPWTAEHAAIAADLKGYKFGSARRERTRALLGVA